MKFRLDPTIRSRAIVLGLIVLGILVWMRSAEAAGAFTDDVTWTLPTLRVDGTVLPASELKRTEVEVADGTTILATDAVNMPATTYTWTRAIPPTGTLCYRARVVDTMDQVSDWSSKVCKTVKAKPNPPAIGTVK